MKRFIVFITCCYTLSCTSQTLTPLATALFKDVRSKLSVDEKNTVAQSTGLSFSGADEWQLDGMPVSSMQVYPADINSDSTEDVFVIIESTAVYGASGEGFILFLKNPAGSYEPKANETGIPGIMKTASLGYPDILVGGPGFEFPVLRWNGKVYTFNRNVKDGTADYSAVEEISKMYVSKIPE